MNLRECQLKAIRHQSPEQFPADVIVIENMQEVANALNLSMEKVEEHLQISGRLLCPEYLKPLPKENNITLINEWGTSEHDYSALRYNPLINAQTISDLNKYDWPDPHYYNFEQLAQKAKQFDKKYAIRGPGWRPLFIRALDLFSLETALINMVANPILFEAVLERIFEFTYKHCEKYIEIMGEDLDIMYFGDDFATQRGMMISPDLWRKYLKPRYAKLMELGKRNRKYIWFHSCGNILDVLDDLIDIGMDVWETVQLHTLPVPPEKLKKDYGKHITFFGGISTQTLPFNSPSQIKKEVRECIDILGENGGYICGPDHHIKPDVPPENTIALFNEIASYKHLVNK